MQIQAPELLQSQTFQLLVLVYLVNWLSTGVPPDMASLLAGAGIFGVKETGKHIGQGLAARPSPVINQG